MVEQRHGKGHPQLLVSQLGDSQAAVKRVSERTEFQDVFSGIPWIIKLGLLVVSFYICSKKGQVRSHGRRSLHSNLQGNDKFVKKGHIYNRAEGKLLCKETSSFMLLQTLLLHPSRV